MTLAGEILIGTGAVFMLIAGLGMLRLPDVFSRMHAGTKAASLGLACVLTGTALILPGPTTVLKLFIALVFQFATAPVAAHIIGRAGYWAGVPLWEGTIYDDLSSAEDKPREVQ